MSRGKYAARAANRLVAFDNELLKEKCAQVDRLRADIFAVEQQLKEERRQRDAIVLKRANELSQQQIAGIRQAAEAHMIAYTADIRHAVDLLTKDFARTRSTPRCWVNEVLPLLIPNQLERSKWLDNFLSRSANEMPS